MCEAAFYTLRKYDNDAGGFIFFFPSIFIISANSSPCLEKINKLGVKCCSKDLFKKPLVLDIFKCFTNVLMIIAN